MQINKDVGLILRDIYSYDIESCHYTILEKSGYDLSHIDKENKLTRNIQIGQMMHDNPRITSLLRTTTESIINDYINKNNIKESEIVLRQYDGLILTRKLYYTNLSHIPLDLRKVFQVFISSIDRKKYIALDSSEDLTIKGVSNRYEAIDQLYKDLCLITSIGKKTPIFKRLQKFRDNIIFSTDINLFKIPARDGKINIFLKGYGQLEVSESTAKIMDLDDIDKEVYYSLYFDKFIKTIVFEFVR